MTEIDPAAPAVPEAREYVQEWASSMSQVLGQIAGAPFAVECDDAPPKDASPAQPTDLQIVAAATGVTRGELAFRLPQAVAADLARIFLSEPQDAESQLTGERREAVEELFRQIAGAGRHRAAAALG